MDTKPEVGVPASETPTVEQTPASVEPAKQEMPAQKEKKKLSKKTLIFAIVAGVLGIAAIVAAVCFLIWYNKPEVVAMNAVSQAYEAKNVVTDGTVEVDLGDDEDVKKVTVTLGNSTADKITNTTNADVSLTTKDDKQIKFTVGEAFAQDGVIYVKIDGVKKAIKKLGLGEEEQAYVDAFEKSIDAVDGQWWKVSVPEIVKELEKREYLEDGKSITEAYACVIDKMNGLKDSDELLNMYKKDPFVKIEDYKGDKVTAQHGGRIYVVKIDAQEVVDFSKEFQNAKIVDEMSDCLKKLDTDATGVSADVTKEEVEISDVEDALKEMPEIFLEISKWKHQLKRIYTEDEEKDSDMKAKVDLSFTYPKAMQVEMPSKSKSVIKLVDVVLEDITALSGASTTSSTLDYSSL